MNETKQPPKAAKPLGPQSRAPKVRVEVQRAISYGGQYFAPNPITKAKPVIEMDAETAKSHGPDYVKRLDTPADKQAGTPLNK